MGNSWNDTRPPRAFVYTSEAAKAIPRINEAQPEDQALLGHLLLKAAEVARSLGLGEDGFRLVLNNGTDAGETVPHLHCHILGGRKMEWPPG